MFHLNTTGLNFKDEKFFFHPEGCSHPFHKDILISQGWVSYILMDDHIHSKGCPHPFQKDGWSHPFKRMFSIHFKGMDGLIHSKASISIA
jgi:hypothetical protein